MNTKKIIGVSAIVIASAAGLGFFWPFGNDRNVLRLHGLVETQEVRLASKIGGRVKNVLVEEGTLVKAGQPLVELEIPELEAQRDQAKAKLDAARASLDKMVKGARYEEKDLARETMKAAQARWQKLTAGFRPEEKDQAKSELESLEADLARAHHDLERERTLFPSAAASKAQVDAAVAAAGRLQGQVNSARAKVKMMAAGYRVEEIAEAAAELAKARANHEMLEAGNRAEDVAEAEARVAELRARLQEIDANVKEAVIAAPERVVVEVIAVRRGDVAVPNQAVVRVLRVEDLWVKAYVPEVELGKVRLNQSVEVTVDSYPGKRLKGTVIQVASSSEFTPRNVQSYDERRHQVFAIKIRVPDPIGIFKSGMAAEVYLPLHD